MHSSKLRFEPYVHLVKIDNNYFDQTLHIRKIFLKNFYFEMLFQYKSIQARALYFSQ